MAVNTHMLMLSWVKSLAPLSFVFKLGVVFHNGLAHGYGHRCWDCLGRYLTYWGGHSRGAPCPGVPREPRPRVRSCGRGCGARSRLGALRRRGDVRGRAVPVPAAVPGRGTAPSPRGDPARTPPARRCRGCGAPLLPRKAAAGYPTFNFCGLLALCK